MLRAKRWLLAWFSLAALLGCGGDTSVAICVGDALFCSRAFNPVAQAGPDQTVASGSLVTLDGSDSEGKIDSYSWAQTGGPVTLSLTCPLAAKGGQWRNAKSVAEVA